MPTRRRTATFGGRKPPTSLTRAAQDERDSARMKQASETAVCRPTGASFLTDVLPLADSGQSAASLSAAVEPGEPAGSIGPTASVMKPAPAAGSLRSTAVL